MLFQDLLNFDDPLNIEAAEHHLRDKVSSHLLKRFFRQENEFVFRISFCTLPYWSTCDSSCKLNYLVSLKVY